MSLDLADSDGIMDKARRLVGHLAAVQGGARDPMKLHVILGAPQDPTLTPAYEKARGLLRRAALNPEVVEESEVDSLVSRIEDDARAHAAEPMPIRTVQS